jgi:hypothetical protein
LTLEETETKLFTIQKSSHVDEARLRDQNQEKSELSAQLAAKTKEIQRLSADLHKKCQEYDILHNEKSCILTNFEKIQREERDAHNLTRKVKADLLNENALQKDKIEHLLSLLHQNERMLNEWQNRMEAKRSECENLNKELRLYKEKSYLADEKSNPRPNAVDIMHLEEQLTQYKVLLTQKDQQLQAQLQENAAEASLNAREKERREAAERELADLKLKEGRLTFEVSKLELLRNDLREENEKLQQKLAEYTYRQDLSAQKTQPNSSAKKREGSSTAIDPMHEMVFSKGTGNRWKSHETVFLMATEIERLHFIRHDLTEQLALMAKERDEIEEQFLKQIQLGSPHFALSTENNIDSFHLSTSLNRLTLDEHNMK